MTWNGLRNEREAEPLYKPVIFIHIYYVILQMPVNWKDKIANPFFPECCQAFTEQLWIESRSIFLLWDVFKMLIYTSRLNNHYHIVTIYNEPLCNVNTSIEGMYKYTFRDQRACIYFQFTHLWLTWNNIVMQPRLIFLTNSKVRENGCAGSLTRGTSCCI